MIVSSSPDQDRHEAGFPLAPTGPRSKKNCYFQHPMGKPKTKLFVEDDRIFWANRIVIPTSLPRKVIIAARHLGHLGTTKIKQMLREKYWLPLMNSMVNQIIGQCYEYQLTTKQHRQEPVKVTDFPKKPCGRQSCRLLGTLSWCTLQPGSCRQTDKIPWSHKITINRSTTYNGEAQDHVCNTWNTKAPFNSF